MKREFKWKNYEYYREKQEHMFKRKMSDTEF